MDKRYFISCVRDRRNLYIMDELPKQECIATVPYHSSKHTEAYKIANMIVDALNEKWIKEGKPNWLNVL